MELTDVQLYVISIVAIVLIYVIRFIAVRLNWSPGRGWLTAFLYVVAAGLALAWSAFKLPLFPAFDGPVAFVTALFTFFNGLLFELGPVVAFATLIYNVLGKKVLDGIEAKIAAKQISGTKKSIKK